jgi:hypothetical protein
MDTLMGHKSLQFVSETGAAPVYSAPPRPPQLFPPGEDEGRIVGAPADIERRMVVFSPLLSPGSRSDRHFKQVLSQLRE